MIGFLASLLGLGDICNKVRKIIDKVKEPIDRAVDYVLELVKGFVQKIAKLLGFGTASGQPEIGDEVAFSDGEENHKLWVDDQGVLMVASNPLTVEGRLADWEARAEDELTEENQVEVSTLISTAKSELASASDSASNLARMKNAVKKLEDGDKLQGEQKTLEAEQSVLAGTLESIFRIFNEPYEMPLTVISFNCNTAKYDVGEYQEQLKDQEPGINSMVV